MPWLTLVVLLVLAVTAVAGWRAGLIKRVLEMAGLALAILLASRYGTDVGLAVESATNLPRPVAGVGGWLVIIGVGFLLAKLVAWGVSKAVGMTILGWVDRTGGAVFGLGVGALILSVLLVLAAAVPGNDSLRAMMEDQPVPRVVRGVAPAMWHAVHGDDHDLDRLWDDARESAGELGREAAASASGLRDGN